MAGRTHKLILLDRDGVINIDHAPHGTLTIKDFHFIDGSLEAIRLLTQAGFTLAIITNQSAVGKGLMTLETLNQIHEHMCATITRHGGAIARIYSCTDHPDHPSDRRKPNAGMLHEALHDFKVDAALTPMIGDALRDLQAAASAGCPRILVRTGNGEQTLQKGLPDALQPVTICADLLQATHHLIDQPPYSPCTPC